MRIIALFFFGLLSQIDAQTDTLPFQLTSYNNVLVEAILNDADTLQFMFHSAATDVSVTYEAVEKLKAKKKASKVDNVNSWGGSGEGSYTLGNRLSLGSYSWDSVVVWQSKLSAHFSDGKFGPNLFEDRYIEFDFDEELMVVHEEKPDLMGYNAMDLEIKDGFMYISGQCFNGKAWSMNRFMIHSGYSGTILLDDGFASANDMNLLDLTDESELKDSQGNVLKKKKAIMPFFDLGDFRFEDLPMGFFEGKIGNQKNSILGGELLKRFDIVLDRSKAKIYLRANTLMDLPVKDV